MAMQSNWGRLNTARQGLVNLSLIAAGLACLAFGVWSLWEEKNSVLAGTGLTAGLVLLMASSIDRFEVLKGLGMEARTRQLNEAITHATGTLEQMREIAEVTCSSIIGLNAGMGMWDSAVSPQQAHETAQRVSSILKGLGSDDKVIQQTLSPWMAGLLGELVRRLAVRLNQPLLIQHEEVRIAHQNRQDFNTPEYADSLAKLNLLGTYQTTHLGQLHGKPAFEWAGRLKTYVEQMPVPENERRELMLYVQPWLTRIEHLAIHYDLSDKEAWYAMLKPLD